MSVVAVVDVVMGRGGVVGGRDKIRETFPVGLRGCGLCDHCAPKFLVLCNMFVMCGEDLREM